MGPTMMKKKKCGGTDSKSERKAKCIRHLAVGNSQNLAKQLRKRRAALAGFSKEQLVNTFLELEAGVAMLEMQVEKVRRAEEEIAEVGEEDYDFFRGEFPMSRETAEKVRWYQERIMEVKEENAHLMTKIDHASPPHGGA